MYFELKKYDLALEDASKAISLNSNDYDAHSIKLDIGMLYQPKKNWTNERGQYDLLVIQNTTNDIESDPHNAEIYIKRATSYFSTQKYDLALADFNKSIELDSQDAENYYLRALYFGSIHQTFRAKSSVIQDINKAIELDSQNAKYYLFRGGYQDNKDQMISDFRKAIELDRKFVDAYVSLTYLYKNEKNYGEAIATINKAVEVSPSNPWAYYYRAYFSYNFFDNSLKAMEDYRKCQELSELDNDIRANNLCAESIKTSFDYQTRKTQNEAQLKANRQGEKGKQTGNTVLEIMGAVTQTLETYNNSRQTTSTSQIPQSNTTSSNPQTRQSGGTNQQGSGSAVNDCNDGIQRGGTGFDCHQFVPRGHIVHDSSVRAGYWEEICKDAICTPQGQAPLSQIYWRGKLTINNSAKEKPYVWTIGFKNTSNSVVVFYPDLVYGDGSIQEGAGVALTPGSEAVWHVTWGTASGASSVSLKIRKFAICTNISRVTDGGQSGYKCN